MSRPDPDLTPAPKPAGYFDPKPDSNEAHRMRGVAVMRRGTHRRLVFAIGKLEMIDDPFSREFAFAVGGVADALTDVADNTAAVHGSLVSFVQAASEMRSADEAIAGIRRDLDVLNAIPQEMVNPSRRDLLA